MPPIWALLNSNLVIAGIGTIILQYIRNQYQSETRKNTLRMEWSKKTSEEQTKLFNDLSNLIACINTGSQILSEVVVEKALDWNPEKYTDLDDEKNDDVEIPQDKLTNNIRNLVNPILFNYYLLQRLIGKKSEPDEAFKKLQDTFTKDIVNWMNPILSNYYQIQRLTKSTSEQQLGQMVKKPQSNNVANLFKASNIKEELAATQNGKVDEKTTLATLVQKLRYKTMKLVELLEQLEEQKKKDAKTKKKPNSQIPTLKDKEKRLLIGCKFEPLSKLKLIDGVKKEVPLCEQLELFEGELKTWLSLLCTYKEVVELLGHLDNNTSQFFEELNKGFQAHLKTVNDYIA